MTSKTGEWFFVLAHKVPAHRPQGPHLPRSWPVHPYFNLNPRLLLFQGLVRRFSFDSPKPYGLQLGPETFPPRTSAANHPVELNSKLGSQYRKIQTSSSILAFLFFCP